MPGPDSMAIDLPHAADVWVHLGYRIAYMPRTWQSRVFVGLLFGIQLIAVLVDGRIIPGKLIG